MLIPARRSRIEELLAKRGMSDLDTLAGDLRVSQSTVRRDIEQLERQGLVSRTHGGVIWVGEQITPGNRPYNQRLNVQIDAKQQIARTAASLVSPGETVLIDGGTTTFYLARELVGQPLQLVTNSLPIANLFLNDDRIELILTGGLMYPRYGVLLGPTAEHLLASIHAKTLFLSVAGIHGASLYQQNLLVVHAEREMMRQAQRVVLLADSAKFDQQALAKLCALREIHTVVSDSTLSEHQRANVRDAGCELIIAEG